VLVVRIPRGIRSKQKLLAILADKLHFPRYFGHNWDALEECLRDLSWLPPDQLVVIRHDDLPFGSGGENRASYLDVLREAAAFWEHAQPGRLSIELPCPPPGGAA
jgi:hypothetical protein